MIERWWDEHCCPMYDNGQRKARTDATNFHQCYHFILDQNKTAA